MPFEKWNSWDWDNTTLSNTYNISFKSTYTTSVSKQLEFYKYKAWTTTSGTTVDGVYQELFKTISQWAPVQRTPEQILASKKQAAIAKAKMARARNKARRLLLEHLNIRQTADFEKFGFFFVIGSEGNLYQIRTGRSHNVRLFDPIQMKGIFSLCAHPTLGVPDYDTMLAQMLWIEYDEPAFVNMANRGQLVARELEELELATFVDQLLTAV
jgi:hypothetical protein